MNILIVYKSSIESKKLSYLLEKELRKFNYCVKSVINQDFSNFTKFKIKKLNLIIAIGGDGTILNVSRTGQGFNLPPIITIFFGGTRGFMSEFKFSKSYNIKKQIDKLIKIINNKNYQIKKLNRINCTLFDNQKEKIKNFDSLNEVTIMSCLNNLIKLRIYIDSVWLSDFYGDGIIISSPTGSTAYSLSSGGAILFSGIKCIQITPICSINASQKPIIIPINKKLKIIVSKSSRSPAKIISDGKLIKILKLGNFALITKSKYSIKIVYQKRKKYSNTWIKKVSNIIKYGRL